MNRHKQRFVIVKEVIDLLRQVRPDLNNELSRKLVPSVDEAIEKLEQYLNDGDGDPGWIVEALKVLAQGLAVLPAIQRLISMMKGE